MSIESKIWRLAKPNRAIQEVFRSELGISSITAQILINRGISTVEEARIFLAAKLEYLHDPFLLKDMAGAVARILKAVDTKEKILIYGDYDVDGITSTTVLLNYLKILGAAVDYYIPDRAEEGYGLNAGALQWASEAGFQLIITVDCGISAVAEVELAREMGLELIITDHHEAPEVVPKAFAVIDPKQYDCNYPFKELAGVGVAWKLGQALLSRKGITLNDADAYYDLVALGTIADIVPLHKENRILVKQGLKEITRTKNLGLTALFEVCGLTGKDIESHHIGFGLAPRLNAAGRLGNASTGVKLLLTSDAGEAREIAQQLDQENGKRQQIEAEILAEAEQILAGFLDLSRDRVIVLAKEGWHPGVIGIVASRLVEKYHRPTIMISIDGEESKGSARSIPGFDLYAALANCQDLLVKFGGHKQAAGLTIKAEEIERFRARFAQEADKLAEEYLYPQVELDGEIPLNLVNQQLIREMEMLGPFGHKNPGPALVCRKAQVLDCRGVGNDGKHLKMRISGQDIVLDTIGFSMGQWVEKLKDQKSIDLAFVPELNIWQGRTSVQLKLKDIKYAHIADNPFAEAKKAEKSFVDQLFDEATQFLMDDYYRHIGQREEFYTKVVGVTFDNRQATISRLLEGEELKLTREPKNTYDPNAIRVETLSGDQAGYLNKDMAKYLAPLLDNGQRYKTLVTNVTGGNDRNFGLNIIVQKVPEVDPAQMRARLYEARQHLSGLDDQALLEAIRKSLLGENAFREKQQLSVKTLLAGTNTLAIFGTGRGKSAVFQSVAAFKAIRENKMTVIIYPLRALVNDQYESMRQKFNPLGLSVYLANGSISTSERAELFHALDEGTADILLTTPEFIEYNLSRFQNNIGRLGFFVVDESHHISLASHSHRPAYKRLGHLQEELGDPLTLAVTATAGEEVATEIMTTLQINKVIVDPHVRSNLNLVDKRDWPDKNEYIKQVVQSGAKTIIYVNSRLKSIELAAFLREDIPEMSEQIVFYNAGMSSEQRSMVERMFRGGEIQAVVSTSAFGEGIDIPDIKHVILYHLNFNFTEFNQQSGRAGRNGESAQVHLIFGRRDVGINEFILNISAPDREMLGKLYLTLKQLATKQNPVTLTNGEIAELLQKSGVKDASDRNVSAGLGIFNELKLIEREREGRTRYITLTDTFGEKVQLEDSLRFTESLEEKKAFNEFWQYIFGTTTETLVSLINRPIFPPKYNQDQEAI